MASRITGVAAALPERVRSSAEVEAMIEGFRPPARIVERVSGVRNRHVAADDEIASDLAVAASRKVLANTGTDPAGIDLLLFGSASQDMAEPATAHVVAAKLGLACPVMDVKNACNSLLNAVQVADALITAGQHDRVLVCTGEVPSRAIRWRVRDGAQFAESFPGYTLSDGGAALLVERSTEPGILHVRFTADSTAWDIGTLPGGGSATSLTSIGNLTAACLAAATGPARAGVCNVADAEPVTVGEALTALLAELGADARIATVPPGLARPLAAAAELAFKLTRRPHPPRLTRYAIGHLAVERTLDLGAARRLLGYRPAPTSFAGAAAWFPSPGW
jgi:3-oxoacyl-[acyl-carrier-protein] synthase III